MSASTALRASIKPALRPAFGDGEPFFFSRARSPRPYPSHLFRFSLSGRD